MRNLGYALTVGIMAFLPIAAKADVVLDFPSSTSIFTCAFQPTGPLGTGGGGVCFNSGDNLAQTFSGTGLATTDQAEWTFSMSDFTGAGVNNTFDLLINNQTVGTFSFLGGASNTHNFDIQTSFAAIAGPTYTLEILATSTVPSGAGSWNWLPGGTVTLSAPSAVPEPSSLALLGFGITGWALLRRRRMQQPEHLQNRR